MKPEEFSQLGRSHKVDVLSQLKTKLQAAQPKEPHGLHPNLKHAPEDAYKPFKLTDIQASYLLGKQQAGNHDVMGCHTYLEFQLSNVAVPKLHQAWAKLVNYHPMLRMAVTKNGQQYIQPKVEVPSFQEYFPNGKKEATEQVQRLRNTLSHKVYQSGEWPLYDIHVTHLNKNTACVHVSMDSWIVDGTSAALLFKQWKACYDDPDLLLPELPFTFRDYQLSLEAFNSSQLVRLQQKYWQDKLNAYQGGPSLPVLDKPVHKTGANYVERKRYAYTLSQRDTQALEKFAQKGKASLSTLLLTIFCEVLRQRTVNERFSLIMTTGFRAPMHEEMKPVVGPFTSTALFLADFLADESFQERAQRFQKQINKDLDHPYVNGVSALRKVPQNREKPPLTVVFNSMLQGKGYQQPGWLNTADYTITQTPAILLEHQLKSQQGCTALIWDVAEGYFPLGVIQSMFDQYQAWVQQFANDIALWQKHTLAKQPKPNDITIPAEENRPEAFALSPLQQAYLVQRATPNAPSTGIVYRAFELTSFDKQRFENALHALIMQQPMLRAMVGAKGKQRVSHGTTHNPAVIHDLSSLDDEAVNLSLNKTRDRLAQTNFAHQQWPAFTIEVSLLAHKKAIIHTVIDMMMADGYSTWLFYQLLFEAYVNPEALQAPSRPDMQDFQQYLQTFKRTDQHNEGVSYWTNYFKYLPKPPLLPKGKGNARLRLKGQVSGWERLQKQLSPFQIQASTLVFTLFQQVLAKSLGQEVTIVHVDFDKHQAYQGFSQQIGDLSTLSWIGSSSTSPLFETMALNQQSINKSQQYGLTFGLEGARVAYQGKIPHYPVVFTHCIYPELTVLPKGIQLLDGQSVTPGIAIDLFVYAQGPELHYHWDIDESMVDKAWAELAFEAFNNLLGEITTAKAAINTLEWPALPTKAPKAPDSPTNALIAAWNNTDCPYDDKVLLHHLFEDNVKRQPEAIASISDAGSLTYLELDCKANQLANYLIKSGMKMGDLVGICLSRSHDMIVTVIAILKAGGAYVPLNIADPASRIASIAQMAGLSRVVSHTQWREKVSMQGCPTVWLDEDNEQIVQCEAKQPPVTSVTSDDLAYVIFTSGSTGTPKGVMVKHKPVVNLIEWAKKAFHFTADDRTLFVSPLSFDLSVFDIFGFLAYGGSIRIVSDEARRDAMALTELLCNEPITFWNSAPAALQLLVPFLKLKQKPRNTALRLVFLSGDWIPLALPGEVSKAFGQAKVIALGGATEATVWSNFYAVDAVAPDWKSIPYGKPIQNARYYILDETLQHCPVGEAGDLYIGGDCLSEGYINNEERTAQAFVVDPFHERHGMKMYRTGDRARWYPDGNIEFLGRKDHQVKINGFRVELGEIEATLKKMGYAEAIVVAKGAQMDSKHLVGFVTAQDTQSPVDGEAIREQMSQHLPAYMVPVQVVVLPAMPVTANGKVDRKALVEKPVATLEAANAQVEAPTIHRQKPDEANQRKQLIQATREYVTAAIQEILETPDTPIAHDENIGYMGFNSLQYTMLSAQLLDNINIEVNPTLFFEYATIDKITDFLLANYESSLAKHFKLTESASLPANGKSKQSATPHYAMTNTPNGRTVETPIEQEAGTPQNGTPTSQMAIAIIGMSGRLPQAENIEAFWQNLLDEKDCLETIPKERWDWEAFYGNPEDEGNFSHSNRGGFMRDHDKFDAAFFGISPREAELMDPRQRLLLESVWHTIENASYKPSALRNTDTGIFIGVTGDEFSTLSLAAAQEIDRFMLSGGSRTILTNRISYYYDWHGPSETIDTACSSALVAIHNAVRAIRAGDCTLAIAGGANLMIDPLPHLALSKIGMLSPDGRCKAFDASANGYARGEGLGTVLLKSLSQAEKDGDHIYAVIKSTAINHGGKANALTAPNPVAQSALLTNAYRNAQVHPQQVGYIEAHGTGTALGDPIEINALKQAFGQLYADHQLPEPTSTHVGLGSVKTNVGHLESAAGVAGLFKALLSLQHQQLPATIHLKETNPHIELEGSPFYLAKSRQSWPQPEVAGHPLPRVAGVSSFGFGGVNAHVVLEEYTMPQPVFDQDVHQVFVFSAKNETALKALAVTFSEFITKAQSDKQPLALADVAYTLQACRDGFEERLAIVARSFTELSKRLGEYLSGKKSHIITGNCKQSGGVHKNLFNDEKGSQFLQETILGQELDKLAIIWSMGVEIDWDAFWIAKGGHVPNRTPLPGYTFEKVRHWPDFLSKESTALATPIVKAQAHKVAIEVSAGPSKDGRLDIVLNGEELYIKDHVIEGEPMLAGVMYAEIFRQSLALLAPDVPFTILRNMVWLVPIRKKDLPQHFQITLQSKGEQFEIQCSSQHNGQARIHGVATIMGNAVESPVPTPYPTLANQYKHYSQESCYALLEKHRIQYGPSLRAIKELRYTDELIQSVVVLPGYNQEPAVLGWHPALLDCAMQTMLLHQLIGANAITTVPFNVEEIRQIAPLTTQCIVLAYRESAGGIHKRTIRYRAMISDFDGKPLMEFVGVSGRALKKQAPPRIAAPSKAITPEPPPMHLYTEGWQTARKLADSNLEGPVMVIGHMALCEQFQADDNQTIAVMPHKEGYRANGTNQFQINTSIPLHFRKLWETIKPTTGLPQNIFYWLSPSAFTGATPEGGLLTALVSLCKSLQKQKHAQPLNLTLAFANWEWPSERLPAVSALAAFGKSIQKENSRIRFRMVCFEQLDKTVNWGEEVLYKYLVDALSIEEAEQRVDLTTGAHWQRQYFKKQGLKGISLQSVQIQPKGTYLITGGGGAIGRGIAKIICEKGGRVMLLGRSPMTQALKDWIGTLGQYQQNVNYIKADISDAKSISQWRTATLDWGGGQLNGVFHCAGQTDDRLLINKNAHQALNVIAPKVAGTINLDQALQDVPMEFMVYFSSLVASKGNMGQVDYAYANRFMDYHAKYREKLRNLGQRKGRTLSIGWPLWLNGGMTVPKEELALIRRHMGMEPMHLQQAYDMMMLLINTPYSHLLVATGEGRKLDHYFQAIAENTLNSLTHDILAV